MAKIILSLFIYFYASQTLSVEKLNIILLRQTSPQFKVAATVLISELQKRYSIKEFIIDKDLSYKDLSEKLKDDPYNLSITLGDRSLKLMKKHKKESKSKIRNIALMGLDLKKQLVNESDMAGINFEVSALSILLSFNKIFKDSPKKLYVYYRGSKDSDKISKQKYFLKKVGLDLIAIDLEKNLEKSSNLNTKLRLELKKLNNMINKQFVWVILDSYILNSKTFNEIWLPAAKLNRITFISGLKHLAKPQLKFCAFALSPALEEMSLQAVQMIDSLVEQNLDTKEIGVEQLVSTQHYINYAKAKELKLNFK